MKKSTLTKVRDVWQRWLYVTGCLLILLVGQSSFAQVGTIGIGSGTANAAEYMPIRGNFGYNYSQQIVQASEYSASGGVAGQITKIRYYVGNLPSSADVSKYNTWTVYLGHTTKTNFSSTSDWVALADLTEVYTGTITFATGSWTEITFTTPFDYNGTDNIVVAVDENITGYSSVVSFGSYTGESNTGMYYVSDSNNPDPASPPSGTRTSVLPRLRFEGAVASCLPPSAFQVSAIATNSATVSWTASVSSPASGYDYYVSDTNVAPTSATSPTDVVASGVSANIGSLSPATQYYVWVRSNCGSGDLSNWVGPISFITDCLATDIPYMEDFESATVPALPICTLNQNVGSGNNWTTYASTANGFNSNVLSYLYNSTNPANTWFYTRGINLTAGVSYRLKYKYGNNGGTTYIEKLKVAYAMTRDAAAMTNVLADHPNIVNSTASITSEIDFVPATTGVYYFGFNAYSATDRNRLMVDDISIDVSPSCVRPTALTSSAVMAESATVGWTAPDAAPASGYQYYISDTNTAPTAGTTPTDDVPTGESVNIASLSPMTQYYVWVRSNCGTGDVSEWEGPLTFTTECVAETAPFMEEFSAGVIPSICWTNTSSNTVANGLWKFAGDAGYAVGNTRDAGTYVWVDGSDPSNISDVTLISPMIDVSALTMPYLTFDMFSNNTGTYPNNIFKVDVQVVGGAWTNVYTNNTSSNQWRTIKMSLPDYVGETIRVRFIVDKTAAPSGNAFYNDILLDNVNVMEAPTCIEVEGALTVNNVTTDSAEVSWTASTSNPASGYDYYIADFNTAPNEFTAPTGNVPAGTMVNIESLFPNTIYYVWVRANCGAGDVSLWNSIPATFTTKQIPATLPYSDDFEGALEWTFVNGTQVNKWFVGPTVNNGGFNGLYVSNTVDGSNNNYTTGTAAAVYVYRDVTLPVDIEEAKITFDWQAGGEENTANEYDYISVWAVPATFTPTPGTQLTVANSGGVQLGTSVMRDGRFNFSTGFTTSDVIAPAAAFAGQTVRLVFEWRNDGSSGTQPAGAIDNLSITQVTCVAPSAPYVIATPGVNTLYWTEPTNVPSDGYDYYVSPDNTAPTEFDFPTGSVASGNSTTIPGLNEDSVYYLWVRSSCGSDGVSVWVAGGSFRTDCEMPYTPEYTNDFTDFAGAMPDAGTICWREATGVMDADPINLAVGTTSWTNQNYNNTAGDNGTAAFIQLNSDKDQWIVTPGIELTNGVDYQLEYSASVIPSSGSTPVTDMGNRFVKVVISTDGGATWEPVNVLKTYDNNNIPAGGMDEVVPLTGYSGVVKIGFYAHSVSTTPSLRFYIDNFRLRETPACNEPTNLVVNSTGEETAEISWDASLSAPADGYEYYYSTDGSTPPTMGTVGQGTVLAGVLSATVSDLSPSTDYFIWVRSNCGSGMSSVWTGPVTATTRCDAPEVSTTTPAEKCGPGSVELGATSDMGTLSWFTAETGGTPVATGETFTTPVLSETTTYYVSAGTDGGLTTGGARLDAPTSDGGTTPSTYGLVFNVTEEFTLNTVDVYLNSSSAGTLVMRLTDSSGTQLQTVSVAVPAGSSSSPVLHTIDLGWTIPAGTGYRLLAVSGPSMIRQFSASYPYPVGDVASVTGGYISGSSGSYYYFYNWSFTQGCTSARVPVTATITDAPEITLSGDPDAICEGETTNAVTILSGAADYDAYEWTPSTGVSGDALTGWTFNPTESTTYTLVASQSTGAMCDSDPIEVNVTVNPLPSAITITPAEPTACVDTVQMLTVSGATASGDAVLGTGTTAPGTTTHPNPFNAWYGGHWTQMLYKKAELEAQGLVAGSSINSVAFDFAASVNKTCKDLTIRIANTANETMTAGFIPVGQLTTVYNADYTPVSGATGLVTFNFTAPFVWDGVSNIVVEVVHNQGNSGNGAGTTTKTTSTSFDSVYYMVKDGTTPAGVASLQALDLTSVTTKGIRTDRPNVVFNYNYENGTEWSPVTNLYTDEDATMPYTGGNAISVYVKSATVGNTTYTATVTTDSGCSISETVDVNFVECGIDWANVQWPANGTINECESHEVYAQVYKDGVTEAIGANESIMAWIGVSDADTDPSTWDESDWYLATFNVQAGNNDEYSYSISGLDAGTYYYASRFQYLNGDYYYGGFSGGAWDGTNNVNGVLTVNAIAAPTADDTQDFCAGATVADLEAEGSNLAWYADETGGTALDDSTVLVDGEMYYVSQSVDGCESSARVAVTVAITTVAADDPADVEECDSYTLPALTVGNYYTETGGAGTMLTAGEAITTTQTIYVYAESGDCSDENSFEVVINVVEDPVAQSEQTITVDVAEDATIEDIEVTADGTVSWYDDEDNANNGVGALAAGTQLVSGTTYYAMQTMGTCVNPNPVAVLVDVVLGTDGFDMAAFSYHPNPVKNELNITYSSDITSVSVFNLLGQEVMTKKVNASETKVDMSALADGAYLVKVAVGNAVKTVKVIKKQ